MLSRTSYRHATQKQKERGKLLMKKQYDKQPIKRNRGNQLVCLSAALSMIVGTIATPVNVLAETVNKSSSIETKPTKKSIPSPTASQNLIQNKDFISNGSYGSDRYKPWESYDTQRNRPELTIHQTIKDPDENGFQLLSDVWARYDYLKESPSGMILKRVIEESFPYRDTRNMGIRQKVDVIPGRSYVSSIRVKNLETRPFEGFLGFHSTNTSYTWNNYKQYAAHHRYGTGSERRMTREVYNENDTSMYYSFDFAHPFEDNTTTWTSFTMLINEVSVTQKYAEWDKIDSLFTDKTFEKVRADLTYDDILAAEEVANGMPAGKDNDNMHKFIESARVKFVDMKMLTIFTDKKRTTLRAYTVTADMIEEIKQYANTISSPEDKKKPLRDIEVAFELLPSATYNRDRLLKNTTFFDNKSLDANRYGNWNAYITAGGGAYFETLANYGPLNADLNYPLNFDGTLQLPFSARAEAGGMVFKLPGASTIKDTFIGIRQTFHGPINRTYTATAQVIKNGIGGNATFRLGLEDGFDPTRYSEEVTVGETTIPTQISVDAFLEGLSAGMKVLDIHIDVTNKSYGEAQAHISAIQVKEKYANIWRPIDNLFTDIKHTQLKAGVGVTQIYQAAENIDQIPAGPERKAAEKLIIHARSLSQEEVTIPDEVLQAYIKKELGLAESSKITYANISTLKEIVLESKGVKSMEGLQYAINLESIKLNHNQIQTIPDLKDLEKLRLINLGHNQLQDISGLVPTKKLIEIYLNNNKIKDITSLGKGTYDGSKSKADLSNNEIQDISPLAGTSLAYTNAENQNITLESATLTDGQLILQNAIKNRYNQIVAPDVISNEGSYSAEENEITWAGLTESKGEVQYTFKHGSFSGTVRQPYTNENPPTEGTITPNTFIVGTDKYLEGSYTGDVSKIEVKVNDTIYKGGTLSDGQFKSYMYGKIQAATDKVVIYAYDKNGNKLDEENVTLQETVFEGTITPDKYLLGTDKYLEGSYTGDVKKVKLKVNNQEYNGGNVENGAFKIYTHGKINSVTDEVTVYAYDKNGKQLDEEKVTVTNIGEGTVTPDAYTFGTSKYVTGSYTGDVVKMELDVDGTIYKGGTVADGKINFYAHGKIKADSQSVNVLVYDKQGHVIDTKPVTLN